MHCRSCGAQLPMEVAYCPTCGAVTPYQVSLSGIPSNDPTVASFLSNASQHKAATDYGSPSYGIPQPNTYEPLNPYEVPPPPPPPPPVRRRGLSAGMTVLLIVLAVLIIGGSATIYFRLALQSNQLPTQTPASSQAPQTAVFASGTWQGQGTFYSGQSPFDMRLNVIVNSNTFSGTLTENVYNTTVNIAGTINGNTISFTDPSYVSGSQIQLNCTYTATGSNGQMSGMWSYPGHSSPDGTITLQRTA